MFSQLLDLYDPASCSSFQLNLIWNEEKVAGSWKEAHIVKIPQKGNSSECNNWRGCIIRTRKDIFKNNYNRIRNKVDEVIRVEQAGFRKERSTINQIFILRNIIEQCVERNETIYMNFFGFSKAFDSINRKCLWKILRMYGLPQKIINIIRDIYTGSNARVIVNGVLTENFEIKTGARQGRTFYYSLRLDYEDHHEKQ